MTANKGQQKPTFKPLSIEQQNAIDLLILGKSDKEVAEVVGLTAPRFGSGAPRTRSLWLPLNADGPRSGDNPMNDSGHS